MSRAALAHSMRAAARAGGAAALSGDPFAILDGWLPDDAAAAAAAPMHGNTTTTFNMEQTLAFNIVSDNYFKRTLLEMADFADLLAEARAKVRNVDAWAPAGNRHPSIAMMVLYRMMVARLTAKQLGQLLHAPDAPLLRAMGLLYLRFTAPPADLWGWFEPVLEGGEGVTFSPGLNQMQQTTLAAFARALLTEPRYYGTLLPRLPVKVAEDLQVKLALLERDRSRARANAARAHLLAPGAKVRARYHGDEKWYAATVDGPDNTAPGGGRGGGGGAAAPRYWVTYDETGDSESISLGRIELDGGGAGGAAGRDRDADSGRGGGGAAAGWRDDRRDGRRDDGWGDRRDDRRDDGWRDDHRDDRRDGWRDDRRDGWRDDRRGDPRDARGRDDGWGRGGSGGDSRAGWRGRSRSRSRSPPGDRRYGRGDDDRVGGPRDARRTDGRDAYRDAPRRYDDGGEDARRGGGGGQGEDDDVEAIRRAIRERERAGAVASGRDYASRPAGLGSALTTGRSTYSAGGTGGGGGGRRDDSRGGSVDRAGGAGGGDAPHPPGGGAAPAPASAPAPPPAPSAEARARMAELQARYGSTGGGGGGGGAGALRIGAARDGDEDVMHVPSRW